jgi:ABC-type lipoprotein release transport system permease subunit
MIESATDTLLGHAQIQHAGFRDEPDLEHRIEADELDRLAPLLEGSDDVRAWAPRLLSGGLVSRKAPTRPEDDEAPAADVASEGAVVLGVQPDRERRVSQLANTVLPDVPASRCLRGCRAVVDPAGSADGPRCEAACRNAAAGFSGAACEAVGRALCGGPCAERDEACAADTCREAFADYCEPARFLAAATPHLGQPWQGEAVLGSGLARQLAVDVGDRVALTTGTAKGRAFASLYRVAGVIHGGSSDVNRSALITHLDKLSAGLDVPGAASAVVLAVGHPDRAPEVAADLDRRVALATPGLRVWSWRELSPELYLLILLDSASLFVTLFLVIMVVGVILMNVVTMSVMERTREYGVRLALGESPRRIMWGLVAETLLLALVAGAAGCVLGEAGTWVLHVYGIDLGVDQIEVAGVLGNAVIYGDASWSGLFFSLGTVVGFSVLGSLYPAWRIHRLQPVVALRFV